MNLSDNKHLVQTVIQYLKSFGMKTKNWRVVIEHQKEKTCASSGLFGKPLYSLHLCTVFENEAIPQFLVDACEFLSQHIHLEGLFRRSGSVLRVRELKGRLQAGEKCLESSLPYDVAVVVKQFLRDLPEPLIPMELQDMLCQAQLILSESERTLVSLLITCLLPKINAASLKYFLIFLQNVASRFEDNKMDVSNLSMVFAPNLFLSSSVNDRHMINTEKQLYLQTCAVHLLIIHADKIGELPHFIIGKSPMSQLDLKCQSLCSSKEMKYVLSKRSSRRRHRYSVGEMVTVALSRLKTGRTTFTSRQSDRKAEASESFVAETLLPSKRKASEDSPISECTAKKRKSALENVDSDITAAACAVDQASTPPKAHCDPEVVATDMPSSPGSLLDLSMMDASNIAASAPEASVKRRSSSKKFENRRKSRDSIRRISSAFTLKRNETLQKSTRLFNLVRNAKDYESSNAYNPFSLEAQRENLQTVMMYRKNTHKEEFPMKCNVETPIVSSWSTRKMTVKHTLEEATFATNEIQLTLPAMGTAEPLLALSTSTHEENDYRSSVPLCVLGVAEKRIDSDNSTVATGNTCLNATLNPEGQQICSSCLQEQSPQAVNVVTVSSNVTQSKEVLKSDRKEPGKFSDVMLSTDDHHSLNYVSDKLLSHVSSEHGRVLRRSLSLPKNLASPTQSGDPESMTGKVNQDLVCSDFHQHSPNVKSLLTEKRSTAEDCENNVNTGKQHCDSQKRYSGTSYSSTIAVKKLELPAVFVALGRNGSDKSCMPSCLEDRSGLVCSSFPADTHTGCLQNEPGLSADMLIMKEAEASHFCVADYIHRFNNLSKQSPGRQDTMKSANVQQPTDQESKMEIKQDNKNSPLTVRRRGARRFGRSLSHESALAIQAKQDLSEAEASTEASAKKEFVAKNSPFLSQYKSPLDSLKKYGRQIFISKKNVILNYTSTLSVRKNLATEEAIAHQGCTASAEN